MKRTKDKSRKRRAFYIILLISICLALLFAGVITFLCIYFTRGNITDNDHQHSFVSTVTQQSTCASVGAITYACECGETYTEDIPVVAHEYTVYSHDGVGHWLVCSMCLATQPDTVQQSHQYTEQITQQLTCVDDGVTTYVCKCGYSYTETQPALGHDVDELTVVGKDADVHYVKCTRCSMQFTRQHVFVDIDCPDNAEPTCYQVGHVSQACSVCSRELHQKLPKTDNHSFASVWQYDANGHFSVCTNGNGLCDATYRQEHTFTDSTIAPTCTTDGSKTLSCSKCNYSESKLLPGGHQLVYHSESPATATRDGNLAYWQCVVCKKLFASQDADVELTESDVFVPAENTDVLDSVQSLIQLACEKYSEQASDEYFVITLKVIYINKQTLRLGDSTDNTQWIEVVLSNAYNVDTVNIGDVVTVKGRLLAFSDSMATLSDATVVSVHSDTPNSVSIFITCEGITDSIYLYATSQQSGAVFNSNTYNFNCLFLGDKVTFVYRSIMSDVKLLSVVINGVSYSPTDTSWTIDVTGDIDAQFTFG